MAVLDPVPLPGWLPTSDMVNHQDPEIRASQVANLRDLLGAVTELLNRVQAAGNVLEVGDQIVEETSYSLSSDPGSSVFAAREDHTHGTPPLSSVAPQDVGSSNVAGTGTLPSRVDHIHEGVHSVSKAGDAEIVGDATISEGTGVTLTQAGQDIEIALAGSSYGGAHALLGSEHSDAATDSPTRGAIIVGNSTPEWDEVVPSTTNTAPYYDGTDTAFRHPIVVYQFPPLDPSGGTTVTTSLTNTSFWIHMDDLVSVNVKFVMELWVVNTGVKTLTWEIYDSSNVLLTGTAALNGSTAVSVCSTASTTNMPLGSCPAAAVIRMSVDTGTVTVVHDAEPAWRLY